MSARRPAGLTRREAALLAAVGLTGAAVAGVAPVAGAVAQARFDRDAAILRGVLRDERALESAYVQADRSAGLSAGARAELARLGLSQRRAVAQFADTVGLEVVAPAGRGERSGAPGRAALEALLAREQSGIAEHAGALQQIDASASAVALARLMAVKAQHLVALRRSLGRDPLPRSFEPVAAR